MDVTVSIGNLKLTVDGTQSGTCIRVHGQLVTSGVPELDILCSKREKPIRLDLSDLQLADSNGIAELQQLRQAGIELTGIPPRLLEILNKTGPAAARNHGL